ncbi:MAG: methionyl-tRNA formyltransferase [Anaerolineae bacterium]|nr:methionyl-tRNA formyltransferase [Anaerolineae bacterium]
MARVVFFGTPEFGVPVLEALLAQHEVLAVVTQPDRPAGRGRRSLQAPPVKELAQARGVMALQPARLRRDAETLARLRALGADVFVLAAYGQILRRDVLEIPPHGVIGVHASLLPKYRGAAPVAAAILQGEAETGVTLMLTDEGMDTGAILAQRRLAIAPDDTTETLAAQLADLGAELLIETLPAWLGGEIEPRPQDDARATYAPMLAKEQGRIIWGRCAVEIDRQIRALTPWPGSYTTYAGETFKILRAHPVASVQAHGDAGSVLEVHGTLAVATGAGVLVLEQVQMAGKRAMPAQAFARGRPEFVGSVLA